MGGKSVEGVLVRRPCARGAPLPGRVWGWGPAPRVRGQLWGQTALLAAVSQRDG